MTNLFERNTRNDHLNKISERGIEQTSDTLTSTESDLLGTKTKKCGEWDNTKSGEDENQGGTLVSVVECPRNWDKEQEEVEWRIS